MNENKIKKIRVRFPNLGLGQMAEKECAKEVLKLKAPQSINDKIFEGLREKSKHAYSDIFSGSSSIQVGSRYLPKIEGFNCTWISEKNDIFGIHAQFTFASGEENKVMRIINKYNGKIIPVREDLNQWSFEEINGTGTKCRVENVNETI